VGRNAVLIAVLLPIVIGVVVLAGVRPWHDDASPEAARTQIIRCLEVKVGPYPTPRGKVRLPVTHTVVWDPPGRVLVREGTCDSDPLFKHRR
jgi:hypothetical protein